MPTELMNQLETEAEQRMTKTVAGLKSEFLTIRAGRANAAVLDKITLDYYGTRVHIKEMANISVPEPRILMISPWDANSLNDIVRAIQASDVGINPNSDGKAIRLVFPELTEERRRDLVKQVKKYGDEAKVAIRNIRRDVNEKLKKMLKDNELTEDDQKAGEERNQKRTDKFIVEIDKAVADKEKEIMEF